MLAVSALTGEGLEELSQALARGKASMRHPDIDYDDVYGLRIEAREKLKAIRPLSVGQASRIPGVNPADVEILLIYLRKNR